MKIITPKSITVFKDLVPFIVQSSHKRFEEIKELALADDYEAIIKILNLKDAVEEAIQGSGFIFKNSTIFFAGYPLGEVLGRRILDMSEAKLDLKPLEMFCSRLFENPRVEVVEELYEFLEASHLPITDDGYFIAYKGVTSDFKDIYTSSMDNSVGKVVSMRPCDVDTDRDRTCSKGLHFAAYEYANNWAGAGHLMAVKVNPAEVVAIPSDYNNQKGRAWRYEVVKHISTRDDVLTNTLVYSDPRKETYEEYLEEQESITVSEEEFNEINSSAYFQDEAELYGDEYGDAYDAAAMENFVEAEKYSIK